MKISPVLLIIIAGCHRRLQVTATNNCYRLHPHESHKKYCESKSFSRANHCRSKKTPVVDPTADPTTVDPNVVVVITETPVTVPPDDPQSRVDPNR